MQTFETKVLAYESLLYHVSWSMLSNQEDCADAVQEALSRAWQNRASLRNEKAFKRWLVQILTNVCNDMLRKRQHNRAVPLDDSILAKAASHPAVYSVIEMLQCLSPEHRLIVVLHYLQGYRIRDIAQMLQIPVGTAKTRLRSARMSLSEAATLKDDLIGGVCHEK